MRIERVPQQEEKVILSLRERTIFPLAWVETEQGNVRSEGKIPGRRRGGKPGNDLLSP